MARHAVVNQYGFVVNVVEWEGAEWKAPDNHYVILAPGIDIGDIYNFDDDVFIKTIKIAEDPVIEQEPQLSLEELKRQIDELKAKLQ